MSTTHLQEVENQIQKYWSPKFTKRLREQMLLASLVNKEYSGEIKEGGDTVKVSQIIDVTGETLDVTAAGGATTFEAEELQTTQISVTANKRAVAALEFSDLVKLQSQIDGQANMDTLRFAIEKQINTFLYSLVAPASSPDHTLTGKAAITLGVLGEVRQLAAESKWPAGSWYGLLSPAYFNDILTDTTLASKDFTDDMPVVGGQQARRLMGFNILEDNSRSGSTGLFFHPDWVHLVMQTDVQVKISDLHAQKKFGYLLSVDVIFGGALGNQGSLKHITVAT